MQKVLKSTKRINFARKRLMRKMLINDEYILKILQREYFKSQQKPVFIRYFSTGNIKLNFT